uniref:Uncharacterized protein n=1 Tax=Arundo donax TaxID=35708 RepID=A0A0A9A1E7_ARUDO
MVGRIHYLSCFSDIRQLMAIMTFLKTGMMMRLVIAATRPTTLMTLVMRNFYKRCHRGTRRLSP